MDVYPLDPLGLARAAGDGWTRVLRHGPMSVAAVLERASQQMAEEDRIEEMRRDPLAYLGTRPRRRLIDVLRRRA